MVGVLETQKRMRFSISWYVKTMIAAVNDRPMCNEFPDSLFHRILGQASKLTSM